jgi:hypothetical protein
VCERTAIAIACCAGEWSSIMSGKLVGKIVSAMTGEIMPARLYVTGSDGQRYYAIPSVAHPAKRELEGHVVTFDKAFAVELPAGTATVRVERGPEFHPIEAKIEVPAEGAVEKKFELRRWIDLAGQGWYSGDLHIHRRLADMHALLLGEDVNVAMPLTLWEGRQRDPDIEMFAQHATPDGEVRIDDRHLFTIYNVEYEPSRSPTGAVLLMGMNKLIEGGNPPPLEQIFDQAHQRGGFVDMEKHSWAWAPVVAATGKCDVFELANNHHWREKCLYIDFEVPMRSLKAEYPETIEGWTLYGFDSWYAYLNCGFNLAPIAGTANGVHPNPFGHNRVYVDLGRGFAGTPATPFLAKTWQRAMLRGESFVTNGPVLFFEAGGTKSPNRRRPGSREIRTQGATQVECRIQLQSLSKPIRVEIVRAGEVVHSFRTDVARDNDGLFRLDERCDVSVDSTTYLAARAFVESPDQSTVRFAHTGVIRVTVPGRPLLPRRFEVDHFVGRVESMIAEIKDGKLKAGDPAAALAEYERALAVYQGLAAHVRGEQ